MGVYLLLILDFLKTTSVFFICFWFSETYLLFPKQWRSEVLPGDKVLNVCMFSHCSEIYFYQRKHNISWWNLEPHWGYTKIYAHLNYALITLWSKNGQKNSLATFKFRTYLYTCCVDLPKIISLIVDIKVQLFMIYSFHKTLCIPHLGNIPLL